MPTATEERRELFRQCTRFVGGHGHVLPARTLAALADEAGADEQPDWYGAGTAIEALEHEVAALLGKPAAVFVPSGTMAQQIALRIWTERRRCGTVAFHPTCHLELHEQRGYAYLHGLRARLVGERHRLFTRADLDAITEPIGALLIELPQREIGGQLLPWAELAELVDAARGRNVAIHLDGARVWETRPFYDREYAQIAAPFDSVYVSFYKILGGISGAALAGDDDFIGEARVWIRRHGGTLVSQYPAVLAARAGLRTRLPRIPQYVARAAAIARVLAAIPGVHVIPDPPVTNMMHVILPGEVEPLLDASAAVARDDKVALFTRLRPADVPRHAIAELAIGDGALALADDVIDALFRRVVGAAS